MTHRKALLSCAAALLALLILLPSVQSADPVEGVKAKIAPNLGMQLSAAKPDDYVTAIVKMNTVADLKPLRKRGVGARNLPCAADSCRPPRCDLGAR